MKAAAGSRWDYEVRLLAWLAVCVSIAFFVFYWRRGDALLYGDAVAHINIARRVFDSKTPGLLQLGTVWLPLPHLLMLPFLISDAMWQTGVGGSIPSLVAYVFGVVGIFRLLRGVLAGEGETSAPARIAAWAAALTYGLNPNLIYMQTSAMGEALYLAFFVWAVTYFGEFARGETKALTKCGICLAAACLTRYDGWFLAFAMVVAAAAVAIFRQHAADANSRLPGGGASSYPGTSLLLRFVVIAAAAPALWLSYNAAVYRNPLEFENGPYSAKAIEARTQSAGAVGHPGSGDLYVAGLYFLKAAEANLAQNSWLQRMWVLLLLAGTGVAFASSKSLRIRRESAGPRDGEKSPLASKPRTRNISPQLVWLSLVLLLTPLPFYALSVAYGGVPIFIPAWWPFTHYNVRYGLQLLPAFVMAMAILIHSVLRLLGPLKHVRGIAVLAVTIVVVASYASVWEAGPVCLREAQINMRARVALQKQLAGWLHALPPQSTLLMYLGGYPGAVQQAGIPLRRVINEGNHRVWKQPVDPNGLWERALADPARYADYVLAFEGDSVWQAVQGKHMKELVEIKVTGEPRAVLYKVR